MPGSPKRKRIEQVIDRIRQHAITVRSKVFRDKTNGPKEKRLKKQSGSCSSSKASLSDDSQSLESFAAVSSNGISMGIVHNHQPASNKAGPSLTNGDGPSQMENGETSSVEENLQANSFMKNEEDNESNLNGVFLTNKKKTSSFFNLIPDLEENGNLVVNEFNESEKYCEVAGRLALLCNSRKYVVLLGELRRRMSPPENLNASLLGGVLRKAKARHGGQQLRDSLKAKGLELPAGRRKTSAVTTFTPLTEGEAVQLSTDFRMLCNNFFPSSHVSETLLNSMPGDRATKAQYAAVAFDMVNVFTTLLESENNSNVFEGEFANFTLTSHCFGIPAVVASLKTFGSVLQLMIRTNDS